ncbi:GGDEF domain-containing protein [Leptolyngbya sp. BL0902]|uniref:EAL domain-containing protein n=1 Tax=Leptolyngbya sp. BL0902 TaxID=1115757 RepID=UPI0018E86674|nr:EAL domain-containing protein [Leptolyngbya sp. BL0902]QQE63712.1 GGDEF domain-containing protein [Leptolyngbya sp. BL0902]
MVKPLPLIAAEQTFSRLIQQWLAAEIGLGKLGADQGRATPGSEEELSFVEDAEAALFRQVFVAAPVGMAICDPGTYRMITANPALGRLLGYEATELAQRTLFDLFMDDHHPPLPMGAVLEQRCRTQSRHPIQVHLVLVPLVDYPNTANFSGQGPGAASLIPLVLAILEEDLQPQSATQPATQPATEGQYHTLMNHLPGAVYRMQARGKALEGDQDAPDDAPDAPWELAFISDGIADILGFSASTFTLPNGLDFAHLIHPEDQDRVRRAMEKALDERVPFRLTYRCLARDGQDRWVLDQGQVHWDGLQPYLDGILIDITDLKTTEAQLAYRTCHDTLTGLPNRALFFNHLDRALQPGGGPYPALAVLMLDIDNFKQVNDCIGHSVGDQLLIEVASRLYGCLHPEDFLARLGGDEFVVQVSAPAGLMEITQLAERIRQAMDPPLLVGDLSLTLSVSIGIALQGQGAMVIYDQAQDMLRDAEIAMYRAKQQGRAQFALYDTSMHQRAMARLEMETALRNACSRDEFVVYYQPIVHLETNALAGFEALVRWQHPTRGLVSPDYFIPVAEEMGLILAIDDRVIALACQHLAQWQRRWPTMPPIFLSLNLSTRHFTRPDLVAYLTQVLEANGLQPHQIKLEVTESALMDKSDITQHTLQTLSQMGFSLSLDDFGTGYSSLSYLHQYPMRTLKIDRSFIINLHQHPEGGQIVGAIVAMAASLNLDVVAEGIETQAHIDYLKQLRCQYGQGYWFAKPLPAEALEPWLNPALSNTGGQG